MKKKREEMEFLTIYKAAIVYGGDRAWGNGAVYGNRNLRLSLLLPSQKKPASIPLQKHHSEGNTWICASEQKHPGDVESQQASNHKGNQGAAQGTARCCQRWLFHPRGWGEMRWSPAICCFEGRYSSTCRQNASSTQLLNHGWKDPSAYCRKQNV